MITTHTNEKTPSACNTKGFNNHTTNSLNSATGCTRGKAELAINLNRASIHFGAINTTKQACNLHDSEIFSCPKFMVLDVGRAYLQGWPHNLFCVDIPHVHSADLSSQQSGFQFNKERETMTNVISLARTRAAESTQSTTSTSDICRQQSAIENALSMAAFYMRLPRTPETLHAAIGKTNRAMTLLKSACTDSQIGGAA